MAENSGQFKAGWSGNPGGRRKDPEKFTEFRELCRKYAPEVVPAIAAKAMEGDVPAATLLLSYAWGKPPQVVTGEGGEGPVDIIIRRIIVDPDNRPDDAEGV